jgi:hypothetical protein
MGLDQYLYKRTALKTHEFFEDNEKHHVSIIQDGKQVDIVKKERISSITELVCSWRKFNALQGYIMTHYCSDDLTLTSPIYLHKEDFEKLLDIANTVDTSLRKSGKKIIQEEVGSKKTEDGKFVPLYEDVEVYIDTEVALKLLPPSPGFFFGSQLIDDYYKENVETLIQELQDILVEIQKDKEKKAWTDWYYTSSW